MDKVTERRKNFKSPPSNSKQTQEIRRAQALEEQKRKRFQQVDASRQLDQFADLNLGDSDDEFEDDTRSGPTKSMGVVAQFVSMLRPGDADPPPASRSPSPYMDQDDGGGHGVNKSKSKKKKKSKSKKKPSKWANKCMYAELLEMREDPLWTGSFEDGGARQNDGLPDDLETAWVGLAPIPVGKRCLAVTMQSAGVSGIVPNTILRSRLLGKVILRPFPSPLPPNTILDCILDENWRTNGLLHVLDVVRWKSQDVGDCEASFRFWWRDTRLSEIPVWPPPPPHKSSFAHAGTPSQGSRPAYRFPYPTTLAPVPYTVPMSFEVILGEFLDKARKGEAMKLNIPVLFDTSIPNDASAAEEEGMEIDIPSGSTVLNSLQPPINTHEVDVPIHSDGLLLYLGESGYESGESPLSVWIPRVLESHIHDGVATGADSVTNRHEGHILMQMEMKESPLDCFERLVRRRLIARRGGAIAEGGSLVDSSAVEVEMAR